MLSETEIRQFTVKNDSLALRFLASQLSFNKGQLQLRDMNYKAASTEVGRLSKKAFNLEIPYWKTSLKECIAKLNKETKEQ